MTKLYEEGKTNPWTREARESLGKNMVEEWKHLEEKKRGKTKEDKRIKNGKRIQGMVDRQEARILK